MGKNVAIFVISFLVAFGGGYLFYHSSGKSTNAAAEQSKQKQEQPKEQAKASEPAKAADPAKATASSKEGEIFTQRGCIQCHSVSALGIKAGQVGPDLSKAYTTVADKHGQPLESFLKKPDSAVMSGVLGAKPLTDDERKAVIAALKLASEK